MNENIVIIVVGFIGLVVVLKILAYFFALLSAPSSIEKLDTELSSARWNITTLERKIDDLERKIDDLESKLNYRLKSINRNCKHM